MTITCKSCGNTRELPSLYKLCCGMIRCRHCKAMLRISVRDGEVTRMEVLQPGDKIGGKTTDHH